MHLPEPAPRLEVGEIVHHLVDGRVDRLQILDVERAAFGVALGELEAGESNLVEIVNKRAPLLQAKLGLIGGFGGIAGEGTLVEALRRRERRLVAEQHFEKVQPFDMAPEHYEAHGERHGEQEAEGSPQPGPEHSGEDHGDGRKAGAVAIDKWLDYLTHDQFGGEEESAGQE